MTCAFLKYLHEPSLRGRIPFFLLIILLASSSSAAAEHSVARQWNEELLDAIRLDFPDPPKHARNLFHTAAAMYGAWAAYDEVAVGYLFNEKVDPLPADVDAARHEAISYAAYRVLRARFADSVGAETVLPRFDAKLEALGYSPQEAQAPATNDDTAAELGKRAADAILGWSALDEFDNPVHEERYYSGEVTPNYDVPLSALGMNHNFVFDMPIGYGIPEETDPNIWQPLAMSSFITQNGIEFPGGIQPYIGAQGLAVTPFSLTRDNPGKPWLDPHGGHSRLSLPGKPSPSDREYKEQALGVLIASSLLNDDTLIDISPGAIGNNPLGTEDGTGFPVNPVTGEPYEPNWVRRGDFNRVLAEYWADGPDSETPPGHWHSLANEIADRPDFEKRLGGKGPVLDDLEWDIKVYFALSAAVHDAACAAWALKRYYLSPRPITMIRYMGSRGQSSDPDGPSYHPQGLPLLDGVVEVITEESAAEGERHHMIWDLGYWQFTPGTEFIGEIAVYSWPGEHIENPTPPEKATHQSEVTWMLARDWVPFQRKSFNTPAFPGYVSGHSTFSRSAAEAMTLLTGSPYFPGGLHSHTFKRNSMEIDLGPSEDVVLQWCTYYDAADQAGISRIHGGIHPSEDDFPGRVVGAKVGKSAFALAEKYWNGRILAEGVTVAAVQENGVPALRWNGIRGMFEKVQYSYDLKTWHDTTEPVRNYNAHGVWTAPSPADRNVFYRVVWSPAADF